MIKIKCIQGTWDCAVYGIIPAAHAARNPMNSWSKGDSYFGDVEFEEVLGDNDLDLMQRLFRAGVEHRTYARMIQVWVDVEAPLYWWKEMDRYTVGKSQVSCSTMHKIHEKEFGAEDFSIEDLVQLESRRAIVSTINALNRCREKYIETKDKKYWREMIQLLPSSYNQKRTLCMSYEVLFKIYNERKGHKLSEWNEFCNWILTLPYMKEIIGYDR